MNLLQINNMFLMNLTSSSFSGFLAVNLVQDLRRWFLVCGYPDMLRSVRYFDQWRTQMAFEKYNVRHFWLSRVGWRVASYFFG